MAVCERKIISFIGDVAEHTFQDGSHSIKVQLSINCPRLLRDEVVDEIVETSSVCPLGFRSKCDFTEQSFIHGPSEPPAILIAHAIEHGTARRTAEKSLHLSKGTPVVVDGQTIMDKRKLGPSTPAIIEVKITPKNLGDRIRFRVNLRRCLSETMAEIESVLTKSL